MKLIKSTSSLGPEIPPFNNINPTAENISMFLHKKLKEQRRELLFKIRVYETKIGKETWCEYGDFE